MGIPLQGGAEITGYDANTITVTPAGGQPVRVARSAAPQMLQEAVQQAEIANLRAFAAAPPGPTPEERYEAEARSAQAFTGGGLANGVLPQVAAPAGAIPPSSEYDQFLVSPGPAHATGQPTQTIERPQLTAPARRPSPSPRAQVAPVAQPTAALEEPGPSDADQLELAAQQLAATMPAGAGGGGSRVTTQTQQIDPSAREGAMAAQEQIAQARDEQSVARDYAASAQATEAAQVAELRGAEAQQLDRAIRDEQADQQESARRYEAETTKLKSLQAEADQKIDPKRWWKEQSTGENILSALALGLGSLGSSLSGTPNFALQIIDKAIDRDINAQLANLDTKGKQVAAQQDLISIVRGQYEDKRDARAATRVLMLERSARYIEQVTARSTSEQAKAKGIEMAAQLREQSAKEEQALAIQLAGTTTTSKTTATGGSGANSAAARQAAAREAVYGKFDPEAFIPGAEKIFGTPMQATAGKDDAKELNKQVAAANDLLRTLDMMEANAKGGKLSPQARTNVDSLRAQAMLKIKNLESGGALDAGMQAIAESMLGPKGTDISTITSAAPQLKANIRASVRTNLGARAVRVDPQRVPLGHRARFSPTGQSTASAPPPTRPISE